MIDYSLKWRWYPPPFTDTEVKTITIFLAQLPRESIEGELQRLFGVWVANYISECTFNTIYTGIFLTDRPVFRLWYGLQETINILEKRHSAWLIQRSKEGGRGGACLNCLAIRSFQWRQNRFVVIYFRGLNNLGQQLREWITITGMN